MSDFTVSTTVERVTVKEEAGETVTLVSASEPTHVTVSQIGSPGQTGPTGPPGPPTRQTHTFALAGPVTTGPIPGFFAAVKAGETAQLINAKYATAIGTASFKIQIDGADCGYGTTLGPLVANPTPGTAALPVNLPDGSSITLTITDTAAGPTDLSVTLAVDTT